MSVISTLPLISRQRSSASAGIKTGSIGAGSTSSPRMNMASNFTCIKSRETLHAFNALMGSNLIGFTIHVAIFGKDHLPRSTWVIGLMLSKGFSSATSFLCLYYLIRNRRANPSNHIITAFTTLIMLYNTAAVALRACTIYWSACTSPVFPSVQTTPFPLALKNVVPRVADLTVGYLYVPLFLWISDAFLVGLTSHRVDLNSFV
jgi:hypothetical protein